MRLRIETKSALKALDEGNGSFEGYGSIFGNYDRVAEAVAPGAFAKSLDSFVADGFIASGHSWDFLPIATISDAKEDAHGLWIKAEFHSTTAAQDARKVMAERLARGKFAGLSIGYSVKDSEPTDEGVLLKELDLFEISFVTVPANPLAGVTSAKGAALDRLTLEDHAELVLAHAKDLTARFRSIHELRARDNRSLSAAKRAELLELKRLVEELAELTSPTAHPDAVRALCARVSALA